MSHGYRGMPTDSSAMRDAAAALGIHLGRCGEETPAPGLDLRHTAGRHEPPRLLPGAERP